MPVTRLTTKSKFKIDRSYWERSGRSFRQELYEQLCNDCKQRYSVEDNREVDHVDPETGEVTRMDVLLDCVSDVCAEQPDFIDSKMPLTRAIFRALLA